MWLALVGLDVLDLGDDGYQPDRNPVRMRSPALIWKRSVTRRPRFLARCSLGKSVPTPRNKRTPRRTWTAAQTSTPTPATAADGTGNLVHGTWADVWLLKPTIRMVLQITIGATTILTSWARAGGIQMSAVASTPGCWRTRAVKRGRSDRCVCWLAKVNRRFQNASATGG